MLTGLILQLFATFFVIGLFTFGGGYAMLSLIQGQVVVAHGWMAESTFTDIVAISQMTPGPIGINCATYVGYDVVVKAGGSHLLGIIGSFTATAAIVLPSFIIVLALARFYMKFRNNAFFDGVMSWLRPAVPGLIGAAAIILIVSMLLAFLLNYIVVGTLGLATGFPVYLAFIQDDLRLIVLFTFIALIIIYRHKDNYQRLKICREIGINGSFIGFKNGRYRH